VAVVANSTSTIANTRTPAFLMKLAGSMAGFCHQNPATSAFFQFFNRKSPVAS